MGSEQPYRKPEKETSRGIGKTKDFLVFLVFVCIAAMFWVLITLNDSVEKRYEVPVVIENIPDSVRFIDDGPRKVSVVIKDKGTRQLRYIIFGPPELRFTFEEFDKNSCFNVSNAALGASLHDLFGETIFLKSFYPDSLQLMYSVSK